jgi:uncharacterized YccA/Bax inhibitor family protein
MTKRPQEDQVRTTSNPAFRNLPTGGGYATFDTRSSGFPDARGTGAAVDQRPMTVDDVVTKTAISLGILLVTGAVTWVTGLVALVFPAVLVGLVLALVITFKKTVSPALIMAYAAVEGVALGGISLVFERFFEGIVVQAVVGTAAVFGGMLVVYKTGAIRVTPRLTKWIIGAMIGVFGLMLVNLLASFFIPGGLGLRDGGALAIIFSLVCIGIAAFSFLLDFDAADQAIRAGVPEKFAWYIAFGLLVTLIWLYLEILRLLSYFRE